MTLCKILAYAEKLYTWEKLKKFREIRRRRVVLVLHWVERGVHRGRFDHRD